MWTFEICADAEPVLRPFDTYQDAKEEFSRVSCMCKDWPTDRPDIFLAIYLNGFDDPVLREFIPGSAFDA